MSARIASVPDDVFDQRVAPTYDADSAEMFLPEVLDPAVDLLAELAGDGAALELAIGTGRVALPLRGRGIDVHGIDISSSMVAELRAKPGGDEVPVTIGDMATTRLDRTFRLAYLVFNTITNLTAQQEQVRCFQNAADHLEPGGRFVIEVFVPELRRLPPGDAYRAFTVTPTHLGFDEYDVVATICRSNHWFLRDGSLQVFVSTHRYVWPAEMDLMAQMAGLSLEDRWGGWRREPYTAESTTTVSVWRTSA
jgi:SAM-dependent methyltransferase